MSTSLRNLAATALLIISASMFAGAAQAAEIAVPYATHPHHHYGWAVRSQLIEGVRGATPLTVPFFGHRWYPGPAYYYGPPPGPCCHAAGEAVISVRY
jgi:hypothetical protein